MMPDMEDKFAHARGNAAGWYSSIEEMLGELVPYESAAKAENWNGPHKDKFGATFFKNDDGATYACADWQALCEAFDIEPEESEDARTRIEQSVLSVQVRDGWKLPGADSDGPEEYEILLTTGGPALRIYGKIGEHGEPESAELQIQDWFLPWTPYDAAEETLLRFARCFYFGEG